MRTLNIKISDKEYSKFGIKNDNLNFTDFIELISKELLRQNIEKSIKLSEKYELATMTMEEITKEVKAVRNNAKNRN